jgi:hypothetical protein
MPGWELILTILAAYAVFWYLLISLLGVASGWAKLGRRYPAMGRFEGTRYRFRAASLRYGMHYNGCVTVGANADGIYLSVIFLFRAGHPPVFVPWADVSVTPVEGWLLRYLEFRFKNAPNVWVRFPRAFGEQIGSAAVQAWEKEEGKADN